jgi:UDP-glucuronate 4-epimerase
MLRDFTYIDDIVEGVVRILDIIPEGSIDWDETHPDPATSPAPYRVYNIGNQHPTKLMDYIACIENAIGRESKKDFLPMQPGDVYQTYADSSALGEATGFQPNTSLQEGIDRTVAWFKKFYNL